MKKLTGLAALFFYAFLGIAAPFAWGAEPKIYDWSDKLQRGVINIVTSPVEVAREIHTTTEEENLLVGWTVGLVKGVAEGFIRFGVGVIELFTFPFDFPGGDKGPILDPEYVWEKPGPRYL